MTWKGVSGGVRGSGGEGECEGKGGRGNWAEGGEEIGGEWEKGGCRGWEGGTGRRKWW